MKDNKTIVVEVTSAHPNRNAWWNEFVGSRFAVTLEKPGLYTLDKSALKMISGENEMVGARIYSNYATPIGEKSEINKEILIDVHPKGTRFLREIRIFRVNRDFHQYDRSGKTITGTFFSEGDTFEEMYDMPNQIKRIGGNNGANGTPQWDLKYINESSFLLPAFEYVRTITVQESEYFETHKADLGKKYKRAMTSLAKLNEKITEFRYLLDIQDDED